MEDMDSASTNTEEQNMGHTQARHFLKTFLKAISSHDFESIEQLRRTLAVEHYRRSLNRGESPCENEIVPNTAEVEKWLAWMTGGQSKMAPEIHKLLESMNEE